MKTPWLRFAYLAAAFSLSAAACAQSGPGMGGPGGGWSGWKWNGDTVPGWQLMTPAERADHQAKMRSARTYDECEAYHKEHRALMEQRAKEKGVTLAAPRRDPCEMMKARGILP